LCHSATAIVARVFLDILDIDDAAFAGDFLDWFSDRIRAGLRKPEHRAAEFEWATAIYEEDARKE
jgi:hypothetical protein